LHLADAVGERAASSSAAEAGDDRETRSRYGAGPHRPATTSSLSARIDIDRRYLDRGRTDRALTVAHDISARIGDEAVYALRAAFDAKIIQETLKTKRLGTAFGSE